MSTSGLQLRFDGKSALITGGAGGLGSACAQALLAGDAHVVIADRPGDRLDSVVEQLGPNAHGIAVDLSNPEACGGLPLRAVEISGRLDVLVSSVGIMQTKPMPAVTHDDWSRVIDLNLTGVFETTREAAGLMSARDGGSIVTIASVAARSGRPNAPAYAASKSALVSLTRSTAMAYGPKVRANAVCPGVFMTSMWESILTERDLAFGPGAGQQYLDECAAKTSLHRLGSSSELAAVVAFLASDLASYVTGQSVNVCGGLEMD